MCFTPAVSLATALIEWLLAVIVLYKFRKSILSPYFACVLFLLGFYQFSEFMLCVTNHVNLWGTAAFIGYTFLPALGLATVLAYTKRKVVHNELIYVLPVVFAFAALILRPFIIDGRCETIFITLLNVFSQNAAGIIYTVYYIGFIVLMTYFVSVEMNSTKDNNRKKVCLALISAVLLMTIPTILVVTIFPALYISAPSVLCHFGLLTAVASFIAVYFDVRKK